MEWAFLIRNGGSEARIGAMPREEWARSGGGAHMGPHRTASSRTLSSHRADPDQSGSLAGEKGSISLPAEPAQECSSFNRPTHRCGEGVKVQGRTQPRISARSRACPATQHSRAPSQGLGEFGGPGRTRTDDRRGVNALLYQLSYRSRCSGFREHVARVPSACTQH